MLAKIAHFVNILEIYTIWYEYCKPRIIGIDNNHIRMHYYNKHTYIISFSLPY